MVRRGRSVVWQGSRVQGADADASGTAYGREFTPTAEMRSRARLLTHSTFHALKRFNEKGGRGGSTAHPAGRALLQLLSVHTQGDEVACDCGVTHPHLARSRDRGTCQEQEQRPEMAAAAALQRYETLFLL